MKEGSNCPQCQASTPKFSLVDVDLTKPLKFYTDTPTKSGYFSSIRSNIKEIMGISTVKEEAEDREDDSAGAGAGTGGDGDTT